MRIRDILTEAGRPKLKLFLSADIVGSTAHKQKVPSNTAAAGTWSSNIQKFYDSMLDEFIGRWGAYKTHSDFSIAESNLKYASNERYFDRAPRLWKTVGDEIIFWKEITHEDQVWMALRAWLDALANVRAWLQASETGLDVKSVGWVTGFPFLNRAVASTGAVVPGAIKGINSETVASMRQQDAATPFLKSLLVIESFYRQQGIVSGGSFSSAGGQQDDVVPAHSLVDFIGSGIDTGFRLGPHSSTRRMVVNVELAYLMAVSMCGKQGETQWMNLAPFHDGRETPLAFECDPVLHREGEKAEHPRLSIGSRRDRDEPAFAFQNKQIHPILNDLTLYYKGVVILKGVAGNKEYPLFYINISRAGSLDSEVHKKLHATERQSMWVDVRNYCDRYYNERKDYAIRPFLKDPSAVSQLGEREPDYDNRLEDVYNQMGLNVILPESDLATAST